MMQGQFKIPDPIYRKLNISWVIFLLLMGCANLFVAYNYSTDTWVNFKLFGGIGLMLLFALGQGLVLSKYIDESAQR